MTKTRFNRRKQDIMRIKSQSGDISRTPIFFNSNSTQNFYEPHKNSIPKCKHLLKKNDHNSIYCDLLGWISPKACDFCRIKDFKRASQEAK